MDPIDFANILNFKYSQAFLLVGANYMDTVLT